MPRIRTIKPEFWDSPDTARASLAARLLFIAMWNWADDYGVGTANPRQLMGFAFPNDDDLTAKDFPTLRKEVADSFGVMFYKVHGRPYYSIPSWDKHQRTERKSKRQHPTPPEGESPSQTDIPGTSDDTQGNSDAIDGSSGVGTGEQGNRGSKRTPSSTAVDALFEDWWKHYPRKVDKGHARTAFKTALKRTDIDTLTTGVQQFAASVNGKDPKFIAHAATWLNGDRWEDDTTAATPSGKIRTADGRLHHPDDKPPAWSPDPPPEDWDQGLRAWNLKQVIEYHKSIGWDRDRKCWIPA